MTANLLLIIVTTAASGFLGSLYGTWYTLRDHRTRPVDDATPSYLCGCEHHLARHDPETSRCHGEIKRATYDPFGGHIGYAYAKCTCRQYVGERPTDWAQLVQSIDLPATRDEERP